MDITLNGEISPTAQGATWLRAALPEADESVVLRVNSGGGDVYEAVTMVNILREHPGTVTAIVEGMAASAASFLIAGGADRVIMRPGSELMVHNPWTLLEGDGPALVKAAGDLARIGDTIAGFYAAKAGGTVEQWTGYMAAETWFSATEAVTAGLADEVADGKTPVVNTTRFPIMAHYKYPSRAYAPAPQIRNDNQEDIVDPNDDPSAPGVPAAPQFTAEQWDTLTSLLSLERQATADEVITAVDALTTNTDSDGAVSGAVRNTTRGGGPAPTIIDAETWAQMQNTLKVGLRAQNQEKRVAAEQVIDQAIRYGKAQARQREELIQAYNLDPEETIRRLRKGKEIPLFEIGHGINPENVTTPTSWVR